MRLNKSDSESSIGDKFNSHIGPRDETIVPGDLRVLVIWLFLFGVMKGRHLRLNNSDNASEINVMINSPMQPWDEMIFPGDLEGSYNIVSSIWSVEWKTYGSIYDN